MRHGPFDIRTESRHRSPDEGNVLALAGRGPCASASFNSATQSAGFQPAFFLRHVRFPCVPAKAALAAGGFEVRKGVADIGRGLGAQGCPLHSAGPEFFAQRYSLIGAAALNAAHYVAPLLRRLFVLRRPELPPRGHLGVPEAHVGE
jgi:hypothetical protein